MANNTSIMKVLKCGQMVVTKLSKVEGMITTVKIDFDSVSYNVTYLLNDKFENSYFNEFEFDIIEAKRQTIGFIK